MDLAGQDGKVAALIRDYDWSATSLGPMADWPECLRAAVDIMLPAHAQIVIFAGAEFVALYNDAYAPTIGDKHPRALGRPAQENWAELWTDLEPLLSRVRTTGQTVSATDRPFYIERGEVPETVFFDISYSPVRDAAGQIHAVFCIVSETTERVKARAAEGRLAAIVASADAAILGTDLEKRVTAWNGGAERLYGYSAQEMLGRPVTILVPPDRPAEEDAIMARILGGERVEPHETQRLRKDGTVVDVSLTVSPIRNDQGRIVGASKIARDITERKEAERLQRVLMGELKHRVKNVLATVQAIARQTFGEDQGDALTTFTNRLRSLSKAHDLLTRENWEGADLSSVVRDVLAAYEAGRFGVEGPRLLLPPRSVVAISLALHELATNAAKYGALLTPSGLVSITWGPSNSQPGRFELRWQERFGPRVAPPASKGFGSRLIEDALAIELDGEVRLSYEPEGVTCIVRAPLDASWERTPKQP